MLAKIGPKLGLAEGELEGMRLCPECRRVGTLRQD
jgi:hypothetical protein